MNPFTVMRFNERNGRDFHVAHHIWLSLALTLLGCCTGILALGFPAVSCLQLDSHALFQSYFDNPLIVFLNLLPPVLLIWLFYFLFGRTWAAFLCSSIPTMAIALVNFFKIRLRSDPFLAVDLRLASEAGNIVGGYTLDINWMVRLAVAWIIGGTLFAVLFMPRGVRGWKPRLAGFLVTLALSASSFFLLYINPSVYNKASNSELINPWSDVEVFVSKGCVYPFLYSFQDMFPTPPKGYNEAEAAALLASYEDAPIPDERKVSVLGIMLEAFCDLTDFPMLAQQEEVAQVYAPWHDLEARSVSGNLLTNIFAGGTVDTEWSFVTGYSRHDDFRKNTDSHVWYFRDQGYQTFGSHPGHDWFYNRKNINTWLGFQEYWFTENHYGALVDPVAAVYHSDHILADELLSQLREKTAQGPCFSFSVSYQNHGPYESNLLIDKAFLTPSESGLTQETCYIFSNYLRGVSETIDAMTGMVAQLEEMEEPVVLVLFGDHKPWAGNGNSAYSELGDVLNISTPEGFFNYYSTPYVIWANPAAKAVLQNDFTGDGGDFSPCFLMTELFNQCGWTGSGFLQLSREVRAVTPLLHVRGLYLHDGVITDTLPEDDSRLVSDFLAAEYYRENRIDPTEDP